MRLAILLACTAASCAPDRTTASDEAPEPAARGADAPDDASPPAQDAADAPIDSTLEAADLAPEDDGDASAGTTEEASRRDVGGLLGRLDEARVATARTHIWLLEHVAVSYRLDNMKWPADLDSLRAYDPDLEIKADPWGNDYVVEIDPETNELDVYSYGADGEPGGEGVNADVRAKDESDEIEDTDALDSDG